MQAPSWGQEKKLPSLPVPRYWWWVTFWMLLFVVGKNADSQMSLVSDVSLLCLSQQGFTQPLQSWTQRVKICNLPFTSNRKCPPKNRCKWKPISTNPIIQLQLPTYIQVVAFCDKVVISQYIFVYLDKLCIFCSCILLSWKSNPCHLKIQANRVMELM